MTRMIHFSLPDDPALLAAVGKVAIRHGQLDFVLRRTIKSIENLTIAQGDDATAGQGSAELRRRVRKLARRKLGEGRALLLLEALLTRAGRATRRRNELLHGLWVAELDAKAMVLRDDGSSAEVPRVPELEGLVDELTAIANELNDARLVGFLKEALDAADGTARTS